MLLTCAVALCGSSAMGEVSKVYTLEELFQLAEDGSRQLRPYFTAREEAQKEISVARSNRLPSIDAKMSISYIGDGFMTKRNLSEYQRAEIPHFGEDLSVTIAQPIYTGGAITKGIEMAELKSTAAEYTVDNERSNIRFRVTGYYLDLYKYNNLRDVVLNNIASARKVLEEMQARYDQGTVLRNDITRYELLVSNLELRLIQINNMRDILNTNLTTLVGLPEGTVVQPDTTVLTRSLAQGGEAWWQQEAENNSSQLKLARQGVSIAGKAEELVRSERLPKVALQAQWNFNGPILVEVPPINRNLSYWFVGLGVSYNISSLFKTNKALAKSRTAVLEAQQRYDAVKENLTLDVRNDYIRYQEAYQELKTQEKSVELAQRNYNTISTRFGEGMALITDMLDAANSRLEAQQNLVNSQINIIYFYYKLLYTSGKINAD